MRFAIAMCLVVMVADAAFAGGVPIQMIQDTFACRDISDTVRLGLRQQDGDKKGFLAFYFERQGAGACAALRNGAVATLVDSHYEQGLHMACIRQAADRVCLWALNPRFGPAPY